MKQVSVIVPIYNVEAYLAECLDSLVNQHYSDMEVLCINDGTKDNSQAIVDAYAAKYPDLFVSYIKENGGLGDARNYGAARASGEYLLFMDSDDFLEADSLKKLMDHAKQTDSDLVLFDYVWYINKENASVRRSLPSEFHELNAKTSILANPSACAKLIRRESYLKANLSFPTTWYEDLATTPAYVLGCQSFSYYPQAIYYYRQRENSITNQREYNPRCMEMIDVMDRLSHLLSDEKYHDELEYLYIYQLGYRMSLTLLPNHRKAEMMHCLELIRLRMPKWRQNVYYKNKPLAFKIYCTAMMLHMFAICKLLQKIRG